MSKFKEGDRVYHEVDVTTLGTVLMDHKEGDHVEVNWDDIGTLSYGSDRLHHSNEPVAEENAVSPNVYKFPNAEVRDISAHLTSFGGQAVQYVARATRLDGLVKGNPVQDIEKAIQVLQWELERLQNV